VVNRLTLRGTHQREFRDMAPTGQEIELKGVTIFRFSPEGKVVETWDSYDQIRLMRQSIVQELRVARSIQQASLPKEVPTLEGWEISPYYQPAREVGGDFYDFHLLSEGRVSSLPVSVVIAACSAPLLATICLPSRSSAPPR
jgi:serine phosphatase RsbU (regulator of sigma subunit)